MKECKMAVKRLAAVDMFGKLSAVAELRAI